MIEYKFHNIELIADSYKDVIQSISNFCNIDPSIINKSDIAEIYNQYTNHPYLGISNALWEKYNPLSQREYPSTFIAYRYHNTGSNGKMEWFSNGLLNKSYGIRSFISNLNMIYNIDFYEFEERLASKCIEKNKLDEDDGPYAFLTNDFAKKINGFDMPEVFSDFKCDRLNNLLIQAKQYLVPTTVVFWYHSPIEMLDRYIKAYCSIILDDGTFETTSIEINHNIPFENIVSIKIRKIN